MPSYAVIAKQFMLGSMMNFDEYGGVILASTDGFYLLFNERQFGQAVGKFQGAIAFTGQELILKDTNTYENSAIWRGDISELPDEVTNDSAWPVLQGVSKAWFIPKATVNEVRTSILYGVKIIAGSAVVNCGVGLFSHGKIRAELRSQGWIQ